jgi:hypothetical protein
VHHRDAIGGLHPRPLELVVERRVLVRGKVEPGRVFHDAHAHVTREAIGEQGIEEADGTAEHRPEHREPALERHQPPELIGQRAAAGLHLNRIENALGDAEHRDGNERGNQPAHRTGADNAGSSGPDQGEQRRNVAQRVRSFAPVMPEVSHVSHVMCTPTRVVLT